MMVSPRVWPTIGLLDAERYLGQIDPKSVASKKHRVNVKQCHPRSNIASLYYHILRLSIRLDRESITDIAQFNQLTHFNILTPLRDFFQAVVQYA